MYTLWKTYDLIYLNGSHRPMSKKHLWCFFALGGKLQTGNPKP